MFDKLFSAVFVITLMLVIVMTGAIVFGVVKGCDYVTSGQAAKDVRTVVEANKQGWDEAAPQPKQGEKK